jgi:hypothetical protein
MGLLSARIVPAEPRLLSQRLWIVVGQINERGRDIPAIFLAKHGAQGAHAPELVLMGTMLIRVTAVSRFQAIWRK